MLPKGLLKEYSRTISFVLRGLDVIAMLAGGLFAYYYRFESFVIWPEYVNALLVGALLTLVVFPFADVYSAMRGQSFWTTIKKLIQAVVMVFVLMAGLAFVTKSGVDYSRAWFACWALSSLTLLIISRLFLIVMLRVMRSHGWNERRVIVIGSGELAERIVKTLNQAAWTGFRITKIFEDEIRNANATLQHIPISETPGDLNEYFNIVDNRVDEIWIALPLRSEERVRSILHELRHHTIHVRYFLDIFGFGLFNHTVTELAGFPTVNLNSTPMVGVNRVVKAIEDRVLATLILLLISPLLLVIALFIKLTSRGPVFFKQLRHGWDGRVIKIYKFRTMVLHQEDEGKVTQAKANDERVTKFGRFLRKTSLDELPQFINVLQGRMSIVGPRPHAISHNEFYKDSIYAYMQRHKVKPGITGWAQVNGWRGETETIDKMQKRVEYDLYYIENWSLGFDFKIIFLTLLQGFLNKNAY